MVGIVLGGMRSMPGVLNGPQLLQQFDERLARAEREVAAAQAEVDLVTRRIEEVRLAETEAVRELARLRLAMVGEGSEEAVERLNDAGARVQALLDERARALAGVEAEIEDRRRAIQDATAVRDREAARLEEAEAAVEAALAAARERLAGDPEWRRLRDAAEEAARIAQHAVQKADFARRDREAKGKPYMADPLFAYLWRRGYGTATYRAGPLVRALDGFVARVARYEPARRSYALLAELPERLAAHAARMREAAEERAAALAAHERRVVGEPEREGELTALRAAEEAAENAVEAAHEALQEAEGHRALIAAGEDAATREALATLEAALSQQSLRNLREEAARTPTPRDDALVATMERSAAAREVLQQRLAQRKAEAKAARDRVQQLLSLRQEMRQRGYGHGHWNFGDGALIGMLIGQVLGGGLSRGGFWGRMEQHRMPGHGPGAGGWGGGPWGGTGGGFGGGGFSTGGGIGGGGFNTGGSF